MRRPSWIVIALLLVAFGGWARSDDEAPDLREQVRTLEARLAALESEGLTHGTELRAQRLVLEDSRGRERILLTAVGPDKPRLVLKDEAGTPRLELDLGSEGGGRLLLHDAEKQQRLGIQLLKGGEPHVNLQAARPNARALSLSVTNERAVGLRMWGGPGAQNETSHAAFCIWHDGTISFGGGLRSAGRTGFHIKYPRDGAPTFEFRDREEALLWHLPAPE